MGIVILDYKIMDNYNIKTYLLNLRPINETDYKCRTFFTTSQEEPKIIFLFICYQFGPSDF